MPALMTKQSVPPCKPAWREALDSTTEKNRQVCRKAPALVPGAVSEWLRAKFPHSTHYHVSAATGISAGTVENWLCGKSEPSGQHVTILLCVFGPRFLAACVANPPQWIDCAAEQQEIDETEGEIARLEAERDRLKGNGKT